MYVLDFMHAFLHCLSSQNYIAKWGSIDIGQPRGQPQTFDTHSFLSAYNYTEGFTGKTSRFAHLSRTEKN